jgi:flagellar basal body-associated protein FliL
MALFSRKSSATTTVSDVPPELQPYYAPSSHQNRLLILPILVLIIVVSGIVGGAIWLHDHKLSDLFGHTTNRRSATQTVSNTPKTGASTSQPSATTQQVTVPVTASSTTDPIPQTAAPGPSSTNQPAIPNTGPDSTVLIASLTMSALGAAVWRTLQIRRATRT